MNNIVENLLERSGIHGVSLQKIHEQTGICKKSIKWIIYNSKNIEDVNPMLHGSCKRKIRVFCFKSFDKTYMDRKKVVKYHLKKPDLNLNDG
jgi:hypothetical protein